MAELKVGRVVDWRTLSNVLATFRLMPASGSRFPVYEAGQSMALRREDCRLTKRIVGKDGRPSYVPDLDESGHAKRGTVTHSYSIASAPCETAEKGYLEFYVILQRDEQAETGRLTESLFRIPSAPDHTLTYVNRIAGDFTLAKRARGFRSVVFVATGTGLAPFVSMIKQLDFTASRGGAVDAVQYTLLHGNRSPGELGFHQELLEIEAARRFDFLYVAAVSRPAPGDTPDPRLGRGRVNNVLRHVLEMPLKEPRDLEPALPSHVSLGDLRQRLDPARTVILTCGNASLMADICYVADSRQIHVEKEAW